MDRTYLIPDTLEWYLYYGTRQLVARELKQKNRERKEKFCRNVIYICSIIVAAYIGFRF